MMENITDAYQKVKDSEIFKAWKGKNESAYLSSFFRMIDDSEEGSWQVDFYNPDEDTITSFLANEEVEKIHDSSKVFKANKDKIEKLNLDSVKIGLKEAYGIIDDVKKEKYPSETAVKQIIILQHADIELWNITYLTSGFKMLNFKINAEDGKIVSEEIKSLFSFQK